MRLKYSMWYITHLSSGTFSTDKNPSFIQLQEALYPGQGTLTVRWEYTL